MAHNLIIAVENNLFFSAEAFHRNWVSLLLSQIISSFSFFIYSLIHPDSSNTSLSTRLVSVQEDAGKSPARNR